MKKFLLTSCIVFSFIVGTSTPLQSNYICPSTDLKNELKPKLKPHYKYDSSKTTRILSKNEKQVKEIEVPLFIGEKYKFIFNAKELQDGVKINIYDKKIGKKNRELLYSSESDNAAENGVFEFEPEKSRTMYIDYDIPATEQASRGCVVFLLGYKI